MLIEISPGFHIEYEDAGQGRPVVFLHAFPLSHEMWRPQIKALQDEFRIIAPDLRGFGGTSPFASTPSIAQLADDLNALLDALQFGEPVVVCGLSMGGYAALHFAHKYSHRLRALILCDTRAEADAEEAKAKRGEMIEFASAHSAREVVEKVLPTLTGKTTRETRPDIVEKILALGGAQSTQAITAALQALRDRPDARPWLSEIKVPTLLIFGEEDALAPSHVIETLKNGIAGAQLVTIERAGHLSNLEQPRQFNEAVLSFLHSLG